jgi:hypothetical protein
MHTLRKSNQSRYEVDYNQVFPNAIRQVHIILCNQGQEYLYGEGEMTYIDQDGKSHDDMKRYSESINKQREGDKMIDKDKSPLRKAVEEAQSGFVNKGTTDYLKPVETNAHEHDTIFLTKVLDDDIVYWVKERESVEDIEYIRKDIAGEQQTLAMVKEMCKGNMEKILQPIRDVMTNEEVHGMGELYFACKETLALADKDII